MSPTGVYPRKNRRGRKLGVGGRRTTAETAPPEPKFDDPIREVEANDTVMESATDSQELLRLLQIERQRLAARMKILDASMKVIG